MNKEKFISKMLCLPPTAIEYHISQRLAKFFSDKALIEGDMAFDVEEYANAQLCTLRRKTMLFNQVTTYWRGPEQGRIAWHTVELSSSGFLHNTTYTGPGSDEAGAGETFDRVKNAWLEVEWQGASLDVLIVNDLRSVSRGLHLDSTATRQTG